MDNFHPVINLKLSDEDKRMIAHNMYSLAEAYCDKVSQARAIYNDSTLVGFAMYDFNKKECKGYVSRLMIATEYQHNGYGTEALKIVLKNLRKNRKIKQIQISYHPDNEKARKSYAKAGFIETDDYVDGEVIALIDVK